ncbi:unnamed protein product [Euphydryas editha]|uniref:Uncharacterized protein n=1 Tax=Euphydryas editha TaxID=104508 RepID=A0AAU9TW11_EUPED|nr:unnamed protein product [Euphydryas editha]
MSLQRTPPSGTLISGSDSGSVSTPNLSTYGSDEIFANINVRKRKQRPEEQDYKTDLLNFKSDIMKFLEDFGKTQNENLSRIRDEILEIKSEVNTVKTAVQNLTQKFEQINTEIESIQSNNTKTEDKVKHIENELQQMKQNQNVTCFSLNPPPLMQENLILELKDRN